MALVGHYKRQVAPTRATVLLIVIVHLEVSDGLEHIIIVEQERVILD
jgi:hypothetical protein